MFCGSIDMPAWSEMEAQIMKHNVVPQSPPLASIPQSEERPPLSMDRLTTPTPVDYSATIISSPIFPSREWVEVLEDGVGGRERRRLIATMVAGLVSMMKGKALVIINPVWAHQITGYDNSMMVCSHLHPTADEDLSVWTGECLVMTWICSVYRWSGWFHERYGPL